MNPTWKIHIINRLNKTLMINTLPKYAIKFPPEIGKPMLLLDDTDLLVDGLDNMEFIRRKRKSMFDPSLENMYRSQYNDNIRHIENLDLSKAYFGVIRNAYYEYAANHNVHPIGSSVPKKCLCETCDLQFSSRNKLFHHIELTNHCSVYKVTLNCKVCDEKFTDPDMMDLHIRMQHRMKI